MSWQIPTNWQSRPVTVLGAGVLGRRIAACFVAAGHTVYIYDLSAGAREQALQYIQTDISAFTALTGQAPGTAAGFAEFEPAVKESWLIFEAVPEVLSLKESVFADLEKHAPEDCILASNSSSYKTSELLGKVQKQETKARVLNTHYMMPPQSIIVELMTCGHTSDAIFPFLADRCKEAGLHPIVALKESTGFIFNRIWAAIKREVLSVLAEGVATPEMLDSMWIEMYGNRKVGPCAIMDAVGLDTVDHIEEHYIKDRKLPSYHLDWLRDNYITHGALGLKSSKGGLYPPPTPGSRTRILLLNAGINEPLDFNNPQKTIHSGQILSYVVENAGSRAVEVLGGLEAPDGIDVSDGRMFWTNMAAPSQNTGSIQSANLDGSDVKYVVKPGEVHTPKQLFVDQDAKKLYYCDREGLRVFRCNLDGSEQEVILQTGDWQAEPEKKGDPTFWPVGITISKKLGRFFWTQKGHSKANEGRIFSAGLQMPAGASASNRPDIEVVIQGLPECIDLEFDDDDGILYWTDRGEIPLGNTLNKKQIIGTAPAVEGRLGRQIIAQGLGEGIGLRLDKANDCLYVADLSGHLWKCSTKAGLKEKLYEGATHAYTGLTFVKI